MGRIGQWFKDKWNGFRNGVRRFFSPPAKEQIKPRYDPNRKVNITHNPNWKPSIPEHDMKIPRAEDLIKRGNERVNKDGSLNL